MKAACSHCGAQHHLSDAQLRGHSRVQFLCTKCGKHTVVDIADRPESTQILSPLPQFARGEGAPGSSWGRLDEDAGLRLPEGKALALSVISGPSRGTVYPVQKPRVIVGRSGADLEIEDPQISRWHCSLEIKDDIVRLRDLESTNGTFLADERVRVAELKHLSEFRIGSSVLLLSVTSKLAPRR